MSLLRQLLFWNIAGMLLGYVCRNAGLSLLQALGIGVLLAIGYQLAVLFLVSVEELAEDAE